MDLKGTEVTWLGHGTFSFKTSEVNEAAYAVKILGAKTVIPMHFRTFPVLTGTPRETLS